MHKIGYGKTQKVSLTFSNGCEDWYNLVMIVFPCASAVVAGSGGHGDDGAPRGDELIVVPK